MKSNKCKNCGANLIQRGGGYYCEYCGGSFVASETSESSGKKAKSMVRPTMTEEVLKEVAFPKSTKAAIIPMVIFAFIWCGTTFGMSIFTFSEMEHGLPFFVPIIPMLMGVFGLVVFVSVIKATLGPKILNNARKLAEEGQWSQVYRMLSDEYSKKIDANIGYALTLVAFYKFKDDEKAKKIINDLNQLNYNRNEKVKEIADYLGVEYNRVKYNIHSESVNINLGSVNSGRVNTTSSHRYNRTHGSNFHFNGGLHNFNFPHMHNNGMPPHFGNNFPPHFPPNFPHNH